jgi:hypothetical protein
VDAISRGFLGISSHRCYTHTGSAAHPASYHLGTWGAFPGSKRPGREVDHFHLVPRITMGEAIPPLHRMTSWRGA